MQLARGVALLRAHNVVHKDLRLENALISLPDGLCVISDFGQATPNAHQVNYTQRVKDEANQSCLSPEVRSFVFSANSGVVMDVMRQMDLWSFAASVVDVCGGQCQQV